MIYQINEDGIFIELYNFNEIPLIEFEGEQITDPSFVNIPIPNSVFTELGVSPKWTGSEWVATSEPPEPTTILPTVEERLETAELVLLELMMN